MSIVADPEATSSTDDMPQQGHATRSPPIPLAAIADRWLSDLACASGAGALSEIDGATLLGERAALNGFRIAGRRSAGGGCRLYDAANGSVALNLGRADDRNLLPALFERADLDPADDAAIAAAVARVEAEALVDRGRTMGLAIAHDAEGDDAGPALTMPVVTAPVAPPARPPLIVDLSALWAGPLATHLLALCGAQVVKVESHHRPDRMRDGDPGLFDLLNGGKASVAIDLGDPADRHAVLALIARADIVVEAARPRALLQLGIDAGAIVRARPGLLWATITGHGMEGDAADWVGFGDDCGIAGGLGGAMRAASGRADFVGDAIADPLTGIVTAQSVWTAWRTGQGGRLALSMRGVVAEALAAAQADDADALAAGLRNWAHAVGRPFPPVRSRRSRRAAPFGADTERWLAATC